MELRACKDTGPAQDLTPAIPPVAAALHDAFLRSHCSSCFRRLHSPRISHRPPPRCSSCGVSAVASYCSPECSASDSARHVSSGECSLLRLLPPAGCGDGGSSADLRVALRLLSSTEDAWRPADRIRGLLADGLDGVMEEGGQVAEQIWKGASLMSRATGGCKAAATAAAALWAVMRKPSRCISAARQDQLVLPSMTPRSRGSTTAARRTLATDSSFAQARKWMLDPAN